VMVISVFCSVPEHKPLFTGGTTANWVSPESSHLVQDDSHIVLML